jgi:hypothetical protein
LFEFNSCPEAAKATATRGIGLLKPDLSCVHGAGGQNSNAGMLPPSDSEEEEEDGDGAEAGEAKPKEAKPAPKAAAPRKKDDDSEDDDDDDDSEEDESSEDDAPKGNEYLTAPRQPKK